MSNPHRRKRTGARADGRSRPSDPFIRVSHRLIDTPAFKRLSPSALKLLLVLWRRHNGRNNGEIPFGVRDAREWGLLHSAAAAALEELRRYGFIECAEESNLCGRRARRWLLTEESTDHDGTNYRRPPEHKARRPTADEAQELADELLEAKRARRQSSFSRAELPVRAARKRDVRPDVSDSTVIPFRTEKVS